VLRASNKLLRPGGRIAFHTISLSPGLSPADRRRASIAGPPAVDDQDGSGLLTRAGFTDVAAQDVTDAFLATTKAWRAARLRHRDLLRPLDPKVYDDRILHGEQAIEATEDGLLRRTLHVARKPG
jgi:hypothetical protein